MDTNNDIINVSHPEMCPSSDEEDNCSNQLKEHIENDSNVEAKNRVAFMLCVNLSTVDDLILESYQEEPLKSYKGKNNTPARELIKNLAWKGPKPENMSSTFFLILVVVLHRFLAPSLCDKSSAVAIEAAAEAAVTSIFSNSSWLKGLDKIQMVFH